MEKGNGCCSIMASSATITFFLVGITLVMCRVLYAMYRSSKPLRKRAPQPVSTLIVLGSGELPDLPWFLSIQNLFLSLFIIIFCFLIIGHFTIVGGHTAEMLNLLSVLQKDRFSPRTYIAAATDNMSLQKARLFENSLADEVDIVLVFHFNLLFSLSLSLYYLSPSQRRVCAIQSEMHPRFILL